MDRPIPLVRRHSLPTAGALAALAVVLPLLAPGFTLVYDMVFVPHPHLSAALLGISPAYPRNVPTQLLVTLASKILSAAVVQKTILLAIFVLAVVGTGRLVGSGRQIGDGRSERVIRSPLAAGATWAVAAGGIGGGLLYAWNATTYERLRLGQWALLLGAAVLPWALRAALRYRHGAPDGPWALTLWLAALVATGPYMAVIGGATALTVALWPMQGRATYGRSRGRGNDGDTDADEADGGGRPDGPNGHRTRRTAVLLIAGAVAVNLVWFVPAALHPARAEQAAASVGQFRARSDSPLGTIGSVLTLGGVWRSDLAPPGRATVAWLPAALLIGIVAARGWRRMRTAPDWANGARTALLLVAVIGVILSVAPSIAGLRDAMVWLVRTLPGGGILRDSQKFNIPFSLLVAVAFGYGIVDAVERLSGRSGARALAAVLVGLPLALAPTLAWGAGGTLGTATYPSAWTAVERITVRDPVPGGILVLPWHAYLSFPWNDNRPVHQPAILFFSRPVLQASALELGSVTLPAEDPWARAATPAVVGRGPLAPALPALGVRYVLSFKVGDWRALGPKTRGLQEALDTPQLTLFRARPPGPIPTYPEPSAGAVIGADAIAIAWLVYAATTATRRRLRRPSRVT